MLCSGSRVLAPALPQRRRQRRRLPHLGCAHLQLGTQLGELGLELACGRVAGEGGRGNLGSGANAGVACGANRLQHTCDKPAAGQG